MANASANHDLNLSQVIAGLADHFDFGMLRVAGVYSRPAGSRLCGKYCEREGCPRHAAPWPPNGDATSDVTNAFNSAMARQALSARNIQVDASHSVSNTDA